MSDNNKNPSYSSSERTRLELCLARAFGDDPTTTNSCDLDVSDIDWAVGWYLRRRTYLMSRRNTLVPICHHLPEDILIRVFMYCTPSLITYNSQTPVKHLVLLLNFTHVCSAWRHLALATASLWTCPPMIHRPLAITMLERAKSAPLAIRIPPYNQMRGSNKSKKWLLRSTFETLADSASICHLGLTCKCNDPLWQLLLEETLRMSHISTLEVLYLIAQPTERHHVRSFPSGALQSYFAQSPTRLRRLALIDVVPPQIETVIPSLTALEITFSAIGSSLFSFTDLIRILQNTPNLTDLGISLVSDDETYPELVIGRPSVCVELQLLRRLSAYGSPDVLSYVLFAIRWTPAVSSVLLETPTNLINDAGILVETEKQTLIDCLYDHPSVSAQSVNMDTLTVISNSNSFRATLHCTNDRYKSKIVMIQTGSSETWAHSLEYVSVLEKIVPNLSMRHDIIESHGSTAKVANAYLLSPMGVLSPTSNSRTPVKMEIRGTRSMLSFLHTLSSLICTTGDIGFPGLSFLPAIDSLIIGPMNWSSLQSRNLLLPKVAQGSGQDPKTVVVPAIMILKEYLQRQQRNKTPVLDLEVHITSKTRSGAKRFREMEPYVGKLKITFRDGHSEGSVPTT